MKKNSKQHLKSMMKNWRIYSEPNFAGSEILYYARDASWEKVIKT